MERMSSEPTAPHAPKLDYLCEDPDCCDNGCPRVSCRSCGKDWPCPDWRGRHTDRQIVAQRRYVLRKTWGNDLHMIEYSLRNQDRHTIEEIDR